MAEHRPKYQPRTLGQTMAGGRLVGYTITCSCGWSQKTNENKREAVKWFNGHKRDADALERQKPAPPTVMEQFDAADASAQLQQPITGALRVWHIPQVPGKPFHVNVKSLGQAKLILNTLALYDVFQFRNSIKPDYSNAQGLEIFGGGEWSDWESPDGDSIDEIMRLEQTNG